MRPALETDRWEVLDEIRLASGDEVVLRRRGPLYDVRFNGWELMSNLAPDSERALGRALGDRVGCAPARVLIGGLGMGFTLRAALDAIAPGSRVVVCELIPQVVAWNSEVLGDLAGRPLDDARVTVLETDAGDYLAGEVGLFDAILLDTDNGPDWIMRPENEGLYCDDGLRHVMRCLAPRGFAGFWSATRSEAFEDRLTRLGVRWTVERIDLGAPGEEPFHIIYVIGVGLTVPAPEPDTEDLHHAQ